MKNRTRNCLSVIAACALFGVWIDFLFNGIVVGYLFKSPFQESWAAIYCPVFLAVAMTLNAFLLRFRFHRFSTHGTLAFLLGTGLGHFALVGVHHTRIYMMELDTEYDVGSNTILLRSTQWPQILFVAGEKVYEELRNNTEKQVPVNVAVVSDYGCDRSAVVSTVKGLDVKDDRAVTWTWQLDHQMTTAGMPGPGTEDQSFFWCSHPPQIKMQEDIPSVRPWERHMLRKGISDLQ